MATANFRINQTGHPTLAIGIAGKSRDDLETGLPCVLRNIDDTGVTSSRWTLTPPKGSLAVLTSPFSLSTSFTPDVVGTYIVDLKINQGRKGQVQRLLGAVRLPFLSVGSFSGRLRYPGAGEDEEANWDYDFGAGPIANTTGWQADLDDWLKVVYNGTTGTAGFGALFAVDTSQPGFTGLVDQWKFENSLVAENATGRDFQSTAGLDRYCKIRRKTFYSVGRNSMLSRGGVNDPALRINGAITTYLLADIHQMPTVGNAIFVFGVPGSNSAGTNYQWAMYFSGVSQTLQAIHEHDGGSKEIVDFTIPGSGPVLYTMRRTADLGGGVQDVSLFYNGALVYTGSTSQLADDGAGTQEVRIGDSIAMLVGDAVVCDEAHSDATVLAVAQQVGVA